MAGRDGLKGRTTGAHFRLVVGARNSIFGYRGEKNCK